MRKVLVADVPQMDARYSAALTGWDIEFAHTIGQARQALAGARYDLVAIGVHFDDSQVFDLVRAVRGDARQGKVPIVCVRTRPGLAAVATRTLETTVKELGAEQLVDLAAAADDAAGEGTLRAAAEGLIRG